MVNDSLPPDPGAGLATFVGAWRYAGALGALAIAVGAAAFGYAVATSSSTSLLSEIATSGLGCGGALLGIAWTRGIKSGHGGFGAVAGSFALALAMLLRTYGGADLATLRIQAALVLAGFVWFAIGTAMVRHVPAARVAAMTAALCLGLVMLALAANVPLGELATLLSALGFGAIAFTGLALAFEMPRLTVSRCSL